MGSDPAHQPDRRVPHDPPLPAGDAEKGWGRIINTASAHSLVASAQQVGLCRRQAWRRRPHQDGRAGGGARRRHRQLHLARLCLDAAGRKPDPRHDEGARPDPRAGDERRPARRPADQAVRHGRRGRQPGALPDQRRGGVDHRRQPRWTAAGPPLRLRARCGSCLALRRCLSLAACATIAASDARPIAAPSDWRQVVPPQADRERLRDWRTP